MPRTPKPDLPDVPGIEAPPPAPMTEDDATAELARIGQALIGAAGDKAAQRAAQADLVALLGKLTPKDFPTLADNPAVLQFLDQIAQAKATDSADPPGTIYNRGTLAVHAKPWTFGDMKSPPADWRPGQALPPGHCEWVRNYRPQRTTPVTWNGLTVQFFARQPWTGPKAFVDVLDEQERLEIVGEEHVAYMFKSGGLPSDLGVITDGTRRVRAQSTAGGVGTGYRPGAGVGPMFWAGTEPGDAGADAGDDAADAGEAS